MLITHATRLGESDHAPVVKSALETMLGGGEAIAFLAVHGRLQIAINFWPLRGADSENLKAVIGFSFGALEGTAGTISKFSILGSGGPKFVTCGGCPGCS